MTFGPGLFAGITVGDWWRMLRANRFAIHPRFAIRLLSITTGSVANSIYRRYEQWRFGPHFEQESVQSPLFVLGHWRSGTTHLHNLLSQDDRFAFPNFYQVLYPHTFLTTEAINSKLLSFIVPQTRFGLDNVKLGFDVPYEDEFAIANMSGVSPYITMVFPRRQPVYDRFLALDDASSEEVRQWKNALLTFLKKLSWKYKRPLVVKSPTHTCRIKFLLELFPDARFVHIRRNPVHVFQSMKKMLSGTLRYWNLQDTNSTDWEDRIVKQYREMYGAYFQQRRLIPDGRLHELSFEDLEADPMGQVHGIYEALRLPNFEHFRPQLREYVGALRGYEKNRHPDLSRESRDRITQDWRMCFEEWGYT